MNQSKRITDGALLVAIYIVLLLIVFFIPFIGTIGIFVLPVPFIFYASRHGWKPSIVMVLVTLILSLIFATAISLPLTILASIGGVAVGAGIHRNLSPYETLGRGTVGFIIGLLIVFFFAQFVLDINWMEEMDTMIEDSINMSRSLMEQTGIGENAEEQLLTIEEQMHSFKDLLPASIAMISMLFAFISQWLSYKLMRRIENKQLRFPAFRSLNFPVAIIWIYFAVLMMSFFEISPDSGLYLVVMNVLAISIMLMIVQGFSFVFFFAHLKKWPKAVPIIIVVLTFLMPFLLMFVIRLIGIIDIGFSMKSRLSKSK